MITLYSYNRAWKPSLIEAVRDVLKHAQGPLSKAEIVEAIKPLDIASFSTSEAINIILGRMARSGEIAKENPPDRNPAGLGEPFGPVKVDQANSNTALRTTQLASAGRGDNNVTAERLVQHETNHI